MAAADQPEVDRGARDAEELHVAAVGLQIWTHAVQSVHHSRLDVDRVQIVEQ